MIITLDKDILIENIIYQVGRTIDKLKDNNYKQLYLSLFFSDWINRQLTTVNYEIQKLLTPILNGDEEDDDLFYFDLTIKHPLQQKVLPQLIEETFTYYVIEMWCMDNNIPFVSRTTMNLEDIKTLALKSSQPITRKYRIIY